MNANERAQLAKVLTSQLYAHPDRGVATLSGQILKHVLWSGDTDLALSITAVTMEMIKGLDDNVPKNRLYAKVLEGLVPSTLRFGWHHAHRGSMN